ncbi:MAG: hypothetical protein A2566_01790 [Candidatus Zambryskibacteria bacterium RIFOXYD1_FULL_40_13]|nr:MAG: NUDIX hydrolase [Parcubacteria group bacterium GW2011_GWC1_39_12]KKR19576.1 MAG: NUDIX hydrolase [Parcubacteria group bacterium GW2011_GWF1_39_37]KKR35730.1 MAG: NUDIX hydrolase [Parcubacteria group bacterium GW2011_GWC2_40_10]KKR52544.1 MAG: NUDIX hydrolase [Parcubacteria group bacterium GW2011_GWE1_40_20]KKR65270.1 MAG: NUDIX hydrolase [Parcubacteria group bacterium GW2011_GWB1_40_5]KKR68992.1 MAG: NUDIX hydrolase [Parcubacteria group bacterium GW2011_GWF2_40_69]KKS36070.1 MAG: NUDI
MKLIGIAVVILYDDNKKILMQQRGNDEKYYAGYWGCFGGHMENDETPKDALERELVEELEYKVKNPVLLVTNEFIDGDSKIVTHNFIEKYDKSQQLVQHEGKGYGWFTVDDALKLKITDLRRDTLLKARNFLDEC